MKLMRVGEKGQEIPVVEYQGAHYDASAAVKDFDPEFFATGGIVYFARRGKAKR